MAVINNVDAVTPRTVKLNAEEPSSPARTTRENCAALKNQGGFTGKYADLVEHVRQFFDETAHQLCNGSAVNAAYFGSTNKGYNSNKHPITIRALAEHIAVNVEGLVTVSGCIDEFIDLNTELVNAPPPPQYTNICTPAANSAIRHPLFPIADPTQRVKAAGNLAENAVNSLIGIIQPLSAGMYTPELAAQYSGGGPAQGPQTV